MKRLIFGLWILTSEVALAGICGSAESDISVKGLGLDFTAETDKVQCEFSKTNNQITGVFKVQIKDLETGIDQRDEHLREALKAAENPEMKFALAGWAIKSGPVGGDFTLNGKTRRVNWKATVDGNKVTVEGELDYTAYGLEQAKYRKAGAVLASVPKVVGVKIEIAI